MNNTVSVPRAVCAIAQACLEDIYLIRDIVLDDEAAEEDRQNATKTLENLLGVGIPIGDDALFATVAIAAAFPPLTVSAVSLDTTEGSIVLNAKGRRIVQVSAGAALGMYLPEGMRFFVTPEEFTEIGRNIRESYRQAREMAIEDATPGEDDE